MREIMIIATSENHTIDMEHCLIAAKAMKKGCNGVVILGQGGRIWIEDKLEINNGSMLEFMLKEIKPFIIKSMTEPIRDFIPDKSSRITNRKYALNMRKINTGFKPR